MKTSNRIYYQYLVKGRYLNGEKFSGIYYHFSSLALTFELISRGNVVIYSIELFHGPVEKQEVRKEMLDYLKRN